MCRSFWLLGLVALLVIGGGHSQDVKPDPDTVQSDDGTTVAETEATTEGVTSLPGASPEGDDAKDNTTDTGVSTAVPVESTTNNVGDTQTDEAGGETSNNETSTDTPAEALTTQTKPGDADQTAESGTTTVAPTVGEGATEEEQPTPAATSESVSQEEVASTDAPQDSTSSPALDCRGDVCTEETDKPLVEGGDSTPKAEETTTGVQQETSQGGAAETSKAAEVQTEAPTKPAVTFAPADPCANARIEDLAKRHFSNRASTKDEANCDSTLQTGWIQFKLDGKNAVIPTECIKFGSCGTRMGFHLNLDGSLPEVSKNAEGKLCGTHSLLDEQEAMLCCPISQPVTVRNCGEFYIYNFTAYDKCPSGICLKLPNEEVPYEYLGNPEPTQPPTTEAPPKVPIVNPDDMTQEERDNVVTVEFNQDGDLKSKDIEDFDKKFRPMVATKLNEKVTTPAAAVAGTTVAGTTTPVAGATQPSAGKVDVVASPLPATQPPEIVPDGDQDAKGPVPPQSFARVRRATDNLYTEDDIRYVAPTPNRNKAGRMQTAVFVRPTGNKKPVSQDRLHGALMELNSSKTIKDETGKDAVLIYKGMPRDAIVGEQTSGPQDVWETHKGIFITIIVLAIICLILLLIGFLCLKCRGRQPEKTRLAEEGNREGGVHSPLSDDEIIRPESTGVQHSAPPSSRQRDEDNGWVVPMDQVNGRGQPDVEDTKL